LKQYYTQHVTKYVLWDLSAADLNLIRSNDLLKVIEVTKKHGHQRPEGRTAIYGSRDVTFAIGRQLSLLGTAYEQAFMIESFRNYEAALDWLIPGP